MRAANFILDEAGPFPGYDTEQRWNGWAVPLFTHEVVYEQVIPALDELGYGDGYYDPDNGTFHIFVAEGEEEEYHGYAHTVDGEEVMLYSIGGHSWVWEVENE